MSSRRLPTWFHKPTPEKDIKNNDIALVYQILSREFKSSFNENERLWNHNKKLCEQVERLSIELLEAQQTAELVLMERDELADEINRMQTLIVQQQLENARLEQRIHRMRHNTEEYLDVINDHHSVRRLRFNSDDEDTRSLDY